MEFDLCFNTFLTAPRIPCVARFWVLNLSHTIESNLKTKPVHNVTGNRQNVVEENSTKVLVPTAVFWNPKVANSVRSSYRLLCAVLFASIRKFPIFPKPFFLHHLAMGIYNQQHLFFLLHVLSCMCQKLFCLQLLKTLHKKCYPCHSVYHKSI